MPGHDKAEGAFRTIGEVAAETGLPQHRLRYWEQRFPQLRPLQRGGQRRYYRPEDVALVRRIDQMLNHQGYTIQGVQKLLANEERAPAPPTVAPPRTGSLAAIRDGLRRALDKDAS